MGLTLGSIPGSTTFLSFPLPFQRSSNSNGLDNLYRSSDLGEPHLSGSQCCDDAQDSFVITLIPLSHSWMVMGMKRNVAVDVG